MRTSPPPVLLYTVSPHSSYLLDWDARPIPIRAFDTGLARPNTRVPCVAIVGRHPQIAVEKTNLASIRDRIPIQSHTILTNIEVRSKIPHESEIGRVPFS